MHAQLTPKQQCPHYDCQNRADLRLLNYVKNTLRSFSSDMDSIHARAMTAMQLQLQSSPRYDSHAVL